jgi:hypothetical protein
MTRWKGDSYLWTEEAVDLSLISIALQIHIGGPAEAWYRDITIAELP